MVVEAFQIMHQLYCCSFNLKALALISEVILHNVVEIVIVWILDAGRF